MAAASTLLLAVTVLWPAWIEAVTGMDPDHSSGALEWTIVFVFAAGAVTFAAFARREWRKHRSA